MMNDNSNTDQENLRPQDMRMTSDEVQMAFEVRRSMLADEPQPDAKQAFARFLHRNGLDVDAGPEGHPVPAVPVSRRSRVFLFSSIVAAACVALAVVLHLGGKGLIGESVQPDRSLAQMGSVIYEAQPGRQHIQVMQGSHTIDVADKTSAEKAGVSVTDDHVITLDAVCDDDHEITTLVIPQGQVAQLVLDDGTKVWLSADSRLVFPRKFYDNMPREVKLYGEAFFEVAHDEAHPFIVDCERFKTTVLGTQFNVRNFPEEKPQVTLVNGRVNVSNGQHDVTLSPEQTATMKPDGRMIVDEADLDVATSWKEGEFYFDGQTLREIMTEIGRWYNMNVVLSTRKSYQERLHFNAERSWTIQEVLRQLRQISNAKLYIKGNTIVVE